MENQELLAAVTESYGKMEKKKKKKAVDPAADALEAVSEGGKDVGNAVKKMRERQKLLDEL